MRRKFSKRGRNDPTTGRSAVTFKFGDESSFSKRDIVKILPFPGPSPAGGPVVPGPPIRNRCPSISRLAPPVAACIQYFMLKMWTSLLVFGPPWLLNPGDGSASFQKSLERRKTCIFIRLQKSDKYTQVKVSLLRHFLKHQWLDVFTTDLNIFEYVHASENIPTFHSASVRFCGRFLFCFNLPHA